MVADVEKLGDCVLGHRLSGSIKRNFHNIQLFLLCFDLTAKRMWKLSPSFTKLCLFLPITHCIESRPIGNGASPLAEIYDITACICACLIPVCPRTESHKWIMVEPVTGNGLGPFSGRYYWERTISNFADWLEKPFLNDESTGQNIRDRPKLNEAISVN